MNGVMVEIRINVRTTEEIKRELEIAAKLRGMTVSSLINSLAVKAIREEKQYDPQTFLAAAEAALQMKYPTEKDRIAHVENNLGKLTDERNAKKKKTA